jgi:hypothetical protein
MRRRGSGKLQSWMIYQRFCFELFAFPMIQVLWVGSSLEFSGEQDDDTLGYELLHAFKDRWMHVCMYP